MDPAKDSRVHLRDYVWMKPPGSGAPEKVDVGPGGDTTEIAMRMTRGWTQVETEPTAPSEIKTGAKGE